MRNQLMKEVTLSQLDDGNFVLTCTQYDRLNGETVERNQVVETLDNELPEFLNEFFSGDTQLT